MYTELRTTALLVKDSLLQTIFGAAFNRCVVKNCSDVVWLGEYANSKNVKIQLGERKEIVTDPFLYHTISYLQCHGKWNDFILIWIQFT